MAQKVADVLWKMLAEAGVKRCYGIVGDALNPVIDALRRNGEIEFIHVRHEEYGVFAAVAEAYLTGNPVVVCGTAGPGVVHLFNGLMDARKEGAAVVAIAGDVETTLIDTAALEELNPYKFFDTACLYVGRVVNPEQVRAVVTTAIMTAVVDKGPTLISIPGDIAASNAPDRSAHGFSIPAEPMLRPADADLKKLAEMVEAANKVTIFGGDGCRDARNEVLQLAARLKAPIGYSFRGKQWLEHDNPNAVGMTGLLGYGGAYKAIHGADLLLMLGTDFPFSEFLPGDNVKKVQIDKNPKHIGRRTAVDLALVGDVKTTVTALLAKVSNKADGTFLERHVAETKSFEELLHHYVTKGPQIKPIRPEFLAATLSELADDDAMFFADTGTACIWLSRHVKGGTNRRIFGSFSWASMANAAPNAFGAQLAFPGRQTIAVCGDGGFTMLGLGDLLTQVQRKSPVVQIILNNESLDFVNIEQQEAGIVPFGVDFKNPNFAKVAEAMGAKGIRIEEPGDVRAGLAEALAHKGGPVVVDAVVDPYALSLPAHVPFHVAQSFTLSLAKQVLNGKMDSVIKTIERNIRLI
ncbi:MAG TPA: thiamine pyrophosphate-dependent enzyme [Candidatus Binatus sp.]|uniref:thiamine pyrophosphate-dependent enzyme n=1 Tax=Candidatus Binatus sp. TaxID=2811406 RepID=UPI002F413B5E